MGYRGRGGYRGDMFEWGQDYSPETYQYETQPDFSDVTGGSSTVDVDAPTGFDMTDLGTALSPFTGGINALKNVFSAFGGAPAMAGSAAAAGVSALGSPAGKRLTRKVAKGIYRAMAGRSSSSRRMNPGNFRALTRAIRRLKRFEHAARRVYQFSHPTRGKSHFKFGRKKRR